MLRISPRGAGPRRLGRRDGSVCFKGRGRGGEPGVWGLHASPAGVRGREGGAVATRRACQGAWEATGAAALAMAAPPARPGPRVGAGGGCREEEEKKQPDT